MKPLHGGDRKKNAMRQFSTQQYHPRRLTAFLPLHTQTPLSKPQRGGNFPPEGWRWFPIHSSCLLWLRAGTRQRRAPVVPAHMPSPARTGGGSRWSPIAPGSISRRHRGTRERNPPRPPGTGQGRQEVFPESINPPWGASSPHPCPPALQPPSSFTHHTLEALCHKLRFF